MEDRKPNWLSLRSDIYLRDKGICWVCHNFTNLEDYDLGHLVDRCNGGHDGYDNLAVMHKVCNLSKPLHNTLEEAIKWRLTSNIPTHHHSKPDPPIKTKGLKESKRVLVIRKVPTREQLYKYKEQVKRIKSATICWIQGRLMGGAIWRVLPPPYRQEDMFIMRFTPPGAIDNLNNSVSKTLQVLDGILAQDVDISIGITNLHISANNGQPIATFNNSPISNTGKRDNTIGMGEGQIPIDVWKRAKSQGISLATYRESSTKKPT